MRGTRIAVGTDVRSGGSVDEMHAAVRVYDAAEFAHLETESGVFEGLLHLTALEEAEVAACPCR